MKILLLGRGVIATQYGWVLHNAGHSVDFYVRPGRAADYGFSISLDIFDMRASFRGKRVAAEWPVRFREELSDDHDYDLIVLSVPHHRFNEAAAFLGQRAGKASVLVFNNFWTDPPTAARALPADQLVWGFPGAGGGFGPDGVLRGGLFKIVHFGTFGTEPTSRELAVRNLFRSSGFRISEHRDFRGWLWTHFALNAGLHAQALQAGSVARMMNSLAEGRKAVLNVRELLPVLRARGVKLDKHSSEANFFRLPASVGSVILKSVFALHTPTRTIVMNLANPEELKCSCRDVLGVARDLGVNVPRLEAARPYFASTFPADDPHATIDP